MERQPRQTESGRSACCCPACLLQSTPYNVSSIPFSIILYIHFTYHNNDNSNNTTNTPYPTQSMYCYRINMGPTSFPIYPSKQEGWQVGQSAENGCRLLQPARLGSATGTYCPFTTSSVVHSGTDTGKYPWHVRSARIFWDAKPISTARGLYYGAIVLWLQLCTPYIVSV